MTNDQTLAYLRTPTAIRERCDRLFTLACADELAYFCCDLSQLNPVADYVIQVMRDEYPDLNIPFHSRWRHFEVGNVPRLEELNRLLAGLTPLQKAQTQFDLAIVSVLLDAGAGADWHYGEPETGLVFQRSEGLAVASFRMFCQGAFSSNPDYPWQADAKGLQNLTTEKLAPGFQVTSVNPLLGLEGRVELLQRLGQSLYTFPRLFGTENLRPGNLVNYFLSQSTEKAINSTAAPSQKLPASTVLTTLLEGLGEIWPGRLAIAGVNLGDVWFHSALEGDNLGDRYVPFHKLSQWLTYSLLEPLQELGLEITGLDELTGLAEYRNGGLCLDLGLLTLKDRDILQQQHVPSSGVIVEWRALTVSLLDRIAATIRQQLNLTATQLPLVKVLQGGTWTAGRRIAAHLRAGGIPPIQIKSDGTVF
ncbi:MULTISPECIES: URC4/urg3 family protein [unclassified Coleofasciculus]|uniref:URC4/urg3 family protein n=1 Tax=unclassified Coleofasciculus TaxID=2692782 RepID=UPI00188264D6|nr:MULTISPECIES: URC4/urg3 family protein [unclassified Coleofasciculus]MBE9125296.1 URC4/urg3 family protein [Coleofasciculus sp. LEGE 07081]MBE9147077.1 URC4/urg3 family protein [Coleofasciculus sp. LEGE 07092]